MALNWSGNVDIEKTFLLLKKISRRNESTWMVAVALDFSMGKTTIWIDLASARGFGKNLLKTLIHRTVKLMVTKDVWMRTVTIRMNNTFIIITTPPKRETTRLHASWSTCTTSQAPPLITLVYCHFWTAARHIAHCQLSVCFNVSIIYYRKYLYHPSLARKSPSMSNDG